MLLTLKNILAASENELRQIAEPQEVVKNNLVGKGFVMCSPIAPLLLVKIEKLMIEEWPGRRSYKVAQMLNKTFWPKDMIFKATH